MRNTTERRQEILEYISDRRFVRLEELESEFRISRSTAKRDVIILSCSYPIETRQGGGGGIYAMEGWYFGRRYLREEQESLLRALAQTLSPEDKAVMEKILIAFAKPKTEKEQKHM